MTRLAALALSASLLFAGLSVNPASAAAAPQPPFIAPVAPWLTTINYYRAMAGLNPVVADAAWSAGAALHSCYMLYNGMSHHEVPGLIGFTPEGDLAGQSANVAVSSLFGETSRRLIELWMTGPFHAIGVLRPQLERVGFGRCDRTDTPKWQSGATLDVIRGLGLPQPRTEPIVFPGDGTTTNLSRFVKETPNPMAYCGWSGQAGLPVLALLAEHVTPGVTTTLTGPGGAIATCTLSQHNTDGSAQALLAGDNVVVAMPRVELAAGRYDVRVDNGSNVVRWSFAVDPAAALGMPLPTAQALTGPVGIEPIAPVRVADTRESFGAATLLGHAQQRIQIGGMNGVGATAGAVSVNVTATRSSAAGYITLWNCAPARPTAATMNFTAGATVANAAIVALDGHGGLCAVSNVDVDIVVDVNGSFHADATGRFQPIVAQRLVDTRRANRLTGNDLISVSIAGVLPAGARAIGAILNVAAVGAAADGFVTVWPCDRPRPVAASLNPVAVAVTSNLVLTAVSASATVCLYTSSAVDLVVDIVGWVGAGDGATFTPSQPFRFVDTREFEHPPMSAGLNGPLLGGHTLVLQLAGQRGIPADATSVVANIAVTDAAESGFLTVYPCGALPLTSNVNYGPGAATSTAAHVPLSNTGQLCVFTQNTAHVVIDVVGWWH